MRIISGSHKGKKIFAPKKLPVRPTTDRSKEALFNILQNQYDWKDMKVIDLFAGTGNISYEFASRGASQVFAVDRNSMCVKFIEQTSKKIELEIITSQSDAVIYLKEIKINFDLIFADPPYNYNYSRYIELIHTVFENIKLRRDGLLIIEHSSKINFNNHLKFSYSRKYSSSTFSFFEK
tara:strand:- start:348 stop:884 length:537 start_codon:yes stop_codon:yes gene_type:complete